MSFEVWTEKYRPKTFEDIVGQDHVIKRIKAFVEKKALPHLLFAGPAGTGKTTTALVIARKLYGKNWRQNVLELNASVSKNTPILVKIKNRIRRVLFKDLDKLYFGNKKLGDSEYVKVDDLEVLTVNKDTYKVEWRKASYFIRHKAKKVVRVRVEGGGYIELTGNHSIITLNENGKLVEKHASELREGDHLISFVTKFETGRKPSKTDASHFVAPEVPPIEGVSFTLGNASEQVTSTSFYPNDITLVSNTFCIDLHSKLIDFPFTSLKSLHNVDSSREGKKAAESELLLANIFLKFFSRVSDKINVNWKYILRHQLYGRKSERISKYLLKKVISNIDTSRLDSEERAVYENLKKLVDSDLHIVKIKSVEVVDYDDYVYDISVPQNEMFFAGEIPILLHNSDERGIDVIRHKVKDFARTKPLGDVPYKLIFLDESDALTQDAQNALRRTMEDYTATCRFILSCNYSSRIIEPIQSRCAVFRFKPLTDDDIIKRLKYIAGNEGLDVSEDAYKAICYIAEGDLRTAINILQAAASVSKKIDANVVYDVTARARPEDVQEIIDLALKGSFMQAKDKLNNLIVKQGLSGEDVIREMHKVVLRLSVPEEVKVELIDKIGEYDFRLIEGADPRIQLDALLAQIALIGRERVR